MALLLVVLFIVVPILELWVIIQVGGLIGVWPTIALLLLDGFVGAWLVRSQGRVAWARFNDTLRAGRVPAREVFDGAMIILGGAFLLAPGFIGDIVGFLLLIPPTRAIVRAVSARIAARHPAGRPAFFVYDRFGQTNFRRGGRRPPPAGSAGPPPNRWSGPTAPPRQDYDFEGSAREISDSESELPAGRENGAHDA